MEIPQGTPRVAYLKQTKLSFFFLLQNCRTKELNRSYLGFGSGTYGGGRMRRKGVGG
jgi:hypothetical protein